MGGLAPVETSRRPHYHSAVCRGKEGGINDLPSPSTISLTGLPSTIEVRFSPITFPAYYCRCIGRPRQSGKYLNRRGKNPYQADPILPRVASRRTLPPGPALGQSQPEGPSVPLAREGARPPGGRGGGQPPAEETPAWRRAGGLSRAADILKAARTPGGPCTRALRDPPGSDAPL